MKGIRTWLRRTVGRENPAVRVVKRHLTERQTTEPTRLYVCEACNITYISTEMESCPKCCTELERIPNGKELGLYNPE